MISKTESKNGRQRAFELIVIAKLPVANWDFMLDGVGREIYLKGAGESCSPAEAFSQMFKLSFSQQEACVSSKIVSEPLESLWHHWKSVT